MTEHPTPPPDSSSFDWRATLRRVTQTVVSILMADNGEGSLLDDLRAPFRNLNPRRLIVVLLALAIVGYLLTGIYVVDPGEAAVVRRFGAVVEPNVLPGLHYRLPWSIDRVDIVNVSEVRREVVGVLEPDEDHIHPEPPSKLQVLSGDTNVIDVELIVQYQVRDPAAYLLNVQYAPYLLVRDVARQAVTTTMSRVPVDGILTTERQVLQTAIRSDLQQRLDDYGSGLAVVGINLQKAFPPDEVAAAFVDVNSAKEDKTRSINEATGYTNSVIPEARGTAQQILANAQAYRSDAIGQASGDGQAFELLQAEYQDNSSIYGEDVTRYRLYLETLETIIPRVQVYVVDMANGDAVNLRLFGGATSPNRVANP